MLREHTYICVDIEAALIRGRQSMIEIGAVKWYPDGTMDTFTQLIQPYKFKKLNSHIQKLTGITSEQLLDAPSFKEAMYKFKRWCEGDCIFLTFGEFDRKVLEDELARNYMKSDFIFPMIDFQQKYMIANKLKEQPSLGGLMNQLGLEAFEQHRALADADSLRRIFDTVNGEAIIQQQKTNALRFLSTSLKPAETHYSLVISFIDLHVEATDITIKNKQTIYEKLAISTKEVQRVGEGGKIEVLQSTTIHPSDTVKALLARLTETTSEKILLTRNGLRPITKVLRLHGCTMQKTEVINLQHLVNDEEQLTRFAYQDEEIQAFEKKICHLLNEYKHIIIDEFMKRDLFPKQTVEV